MKKSTTKLSIVIGLLFLTTNIFACSCDRIGVIKGQKYADIVFVGRVIKINEIITTEGQLEDGRKIEYKRYEFVFKVMSVYKGKKNTFLKDTLTIVSTGGGADCGSWFDENKKYLVYSHKSSKKLGQFWNQDTDPFMTTSLCTRTKKTGLFTFVEKLILRLS